ncbi:hypothetical protein [Paraburkholderia phenazinium]|nr:hypothetical protein [Paraburkholderia phenazinium]
MDLQKQTGKFEHAIGDLKAKIEQQDIAALRERLAKIESSLGHVASQKDVSTLEATLVKWMVATALAVAAIIVAALKLLH